MKRESLSFCICLLLLLLTVSGCGEAESEDTPIVTTPTAQTPIPSTPNEQELIDLTSGGETVLPYLYWSWSDSWTGDGWLAADALGLFYALPEIAEVLPSVPYHEDFAVQYQEGVTFAYMSIYDEGFERLHHNFPDMDLFLLKELPKGTYYVGISVVVEGKYIESENKYEHSGYDCVFRLEVAQ